MSLETMLKNLYCFDVILYGYGVNGKRIFGILTVVNGRFCPKSVRSFCPIVAGFNAGTYKVPACVL